MEKRNNHATTILPGARVFGTARVYGDAKVFGLPVADSTAYRGGWVRAMLDIQDNRSDRTAEVQMSHTEDYANGYSDAWEHFNGRDFPRARTQAAQLLMGQYREFYGQSGFCHPNP